MNMKQIYWVQDHVSESTMKKVISLNFLIIAKPLEKLLNLLAQQLVLEICWFS